MNEQVLRFSAGPVRFLDVLQPQQLLDDPVAHSHGADQNKQVKDQLAHVAPYGGNRRDVGIDRRRRGRHNREDDAGKRNNRPFEANACIGTQEVFPNIAGGFPGEAGHGNWGDSRIHVQFEHPTIHRQDHNECQHRDEQAAQQGDCPQGDAVPKAHGIDLVNNLLRERRSAASRQAGLRDDGGHHPLNDPENSQHQVEAVSHRRLCQHKANEHLESGLRALQVGKARTGLDDADCEKQDQQPVPDGFQGPVDVQHDLPDSAAFEGRGILREQRPDFRQLVVPRSKRSI